MLNRDRSGRAGLTAALAIGLAVAVVVAALVIFWAPLHQKFVPGPPMPSGSEISFEQSGLSGQSWSVRLSNTTGPVVSQSSTGPSIVFHVPPGVYKFTVTTPTGYLADPSSGNLTVTGKNPAVVPVAFSTTSKLPTPIQHVFLIMMENEGTDQIYGVQPYETKLANTYAWGGNAVTSAGGVGYYAACHPSAPNYLAITSGQTLQCGSDNYNTYSVNNLGNLLQNAGESWVAYEESASVACQTYNSGEYAVKHNPFPYYSDLGGSTAGSVCSTHDLPIANLTAGYPYTSTPPAFTYIAPNLLNDGHDTSAAYADAWLATFIPKLIAAPWFTSSVIFIAYDESYGANSNGGYGGLSGGPVYMVALSPYTMGVGALGTDASHYNLLSTTEWLLGLPATGTGHDGTTSFPAMKALFNFNLPAVPARSGTFGIPESVNPNVLGEFIGVLSGAAAAVAVGILGRGSRRGPRNPPPPA